MRYPLFITLLLLAIRPIAFAQEPAVGRWTNTGDETRITLPTSETGRVVITKDNPCASGYNELLRMQVATSPREYIGFRNGTTGSMLVPVLLSYTENNAGSAMVLASVTNPVNDLNSNSPMILFDTRTQTDNTLKTGAGALLSRPLFSWRNYTTVHMQMAANGNLGLGTQRPQAQLHTTGTVRFGGIPTGSGVAFLMTDGEGNLMRHTLPSSTSISSFSSSVGSNNLLKYNGDGVLVNSQLVDNGVGIGLGGVPSANAKLTLYGAMNLMSDARSKTNVVRMTNALQKVNALNGYYYDWKNGSGGREVGFLAQEVEQVLPEVVSENADGVKFLNYDGVLPLLTEAIKEQQALIKSQGALIEQLRREVDALKRKR
ncbi:Long tail fiber protein p37 Protein Gp37 [Fibrella aestuarina BUZ 2]|uniref:Long tail fiber protein p37 Protein Gp37 n=1 Tax=Fibrella aestuarina BUZ 2 TaxID=1166018 RepID=I0K4T9_9BACT|nr:tail fiber domain-containing protein [Fibrella aestuarina]CCG99142.1 Long tail fiber protein p37 Protein Gp37 [Fibrella aestuarina BUZ 2]